MTMQDLTLGSLLDQEDSSLRLVVGADDCRGRVVRGVHCTEVEHPSRWLAPGWVMVTTGMRFADDADQQRSLVAELAEADLVALGFGTGMTFETIPEPIVEEARSRRFPQASEQLAQPVVEAAGRLLAVMANARRISASEEREIRRAFVADLASAEPGMLGTLEERAAVGRSADALPLHPSSLRCRLARIEKSMVASLRHPATIANLYLATMLHKAGRGDTRSQR